MSSSITIVPFLNRLSDLIINPLILLLFSVAFLYFVYGVFKFITLDAADAKRVEARNAIAWGIIGMVIMFSVYGIIRFVLDTFGISPADIKSTNATDYLKL